MEPVEPANGELEVLKGGFPPFYGGPANLWHGTVRGPGPRPCRGSPRPVVSRLRLETSAECSATVGPPALGVSARLSAASPPSPGASARPPLAVASPPPGRARRLRWPRAYRRRASPVARGVHPPRGAALRCGRGGGRRARHAAPIPPPARCAWPPPALSSGSLAVALLPLRARPCAFLAAPGPPLAAPGPLGRGSGPLAPALAPPAGGLWAAAGGPLTAPAPRRWGFWPPLAAIWGARGRWPLPPRRWGTMV